LLQQRVPGFAFLHFVNFFDLVVLLVLEQLVNANVDKTISITTTEKNEARLFIVVDFIVCISYQYSVIQAKY
jgi:hypothetical protein